MLRFVNYNIVFQEVPGEVTLAINLSNCPNRCRGCHSPYLQEDAGDVLDKSCLEALLEKYGRAVTCICFMGGDADAQEIARLACFIQQKTCGQTRTAWYSGKACLPAGFALSHFNYIKLGAYIEQRGGLDSETTNQRFYRIDNGNMVDITGKFLKKSYEFEDLKI
jgi:anaerobic ribonucleoside-triphosphate reductase activating protein